MDRRFDVCEAFYVYSLGYGGDGCDYESRIMRRLEKLNFRSPGVSGPEDLSEEGKAVYARLVRREQSRVVAVLRFHRAANGRIRGLGMLPGHVICHEYARAVDCYRPEE